MRRPVAALAAIALAVPLAAAPAAPPAPSRPARCDIGNDNGEAYKGPCNFTAERDGSFWVERGDEVLMGETVMVTVQMLRPGVAEVRGLTRGGISSRWGEARRSKKDKACWRGSDFWVCAY